MTTSRTTICSPAEVLAALGKAGTATDNDRGMVNMLLPMTDDTIRTYLGWNVIQRSYTHLLPDIDMYDSVYNTPWDLGEPYDAFNGRIAFGTLGLPQIIQLNEIPLRSVQSFQVDFAAAGGQASADFPSTTQLQLGSDYYLAFDAPDAGQTIPYQSGIDWTGQIRRFMGGIWPYRMQTGLITYTAGLTPNELDGVTVIQSRRVTNIKYAAIITALAAFRELTAWGDRSAGQEPGPIVAERLADYSADYAEAAVLQVAGLMQDLPAKAKRLLDPFRRLR